MERIITPVTVTSPTDKQSAGTAVVENWGQPERLRRSLKYLGMCWGTAVVAVAFPIVHFVLVPGFLISGPALAYYLYQQGSSLAGGEIHCPDCDTPIQIQRGAAKWPTEEMCTKCRTMLTISPS